MVSHRPVVAQRCSPGVSEQVRRCAHLIESPLFDILDRGGGLWLTAAAQVRVEAAGGGNGTAAANGRPRGRALAARGVANSVLFVT